MIDDFKRVNPTGPGYQELFFIKNFFFSTLDEPELESPFAVSIMFGIGSLSV